MPEKSPSLKLLCIASSAALAGLAVLIAYFPILNMSPLLDEKYMLARLGDLGSWLSFAGPDRLESWGVLASFLLYLQHLLAFGSIFLLRVQGIFIHWLSSLIVCLIALELTFQNRERDIDRPVAIAFAFIAAILFALYPLSPEAVAWIGGRAVETSTCFFLVALYAFVGAIDKESGSKRKLLTVSASFFYLLSIFTDYSTGFAAPLFPLAQLLFARGHAGSAGSADHQVEGRVGRASQYAPAITLFTLGIAAALAQYFFGHKPVFCFATSISDWQHVLRNLFMPINRARWKRYVPQYRYLYFTLVPLLILTLSTAIKSRRSAKILLFSLAWLLLMVWPFAGLATNSDALYGSRWLYLASAPLSLLIALGALAPAILISKYKKVTMPIAFVLLILIAVFDFRHTLNQTNSYRIAAKILRNIQQSVEIVSARENAPLLLVRDLPDYLSIVPAISPFHIIALEPKSGLVRALQVPGGALKECLRKGLYRAVTLRWEERLHGLLPVELNPETDQFGAEKNARQIAELSQPPLKYLSNTRFDEQEQAIDIESNSTSGPVLNMSGWGLSPLDGDFFYTEAAIKSPHQDAPTIVELNWLTNIRADHEHEDRRTWTEEDAREEPGKDGFHRYYLSLRSTGFTTAGTITTMTLGFPAGSKVAVRSVGVLPATGLIPHLSLSASEPQGTSKHHFQELCCDYPNLPELGLIAMRGKQAAITCTYDASQIAGATSAICQITPLTDRLTSENGDHYDRSEGVSIPGKGAAGEIHIDTSAFTSSGTYRLRLIACDDSGNVKGRFSDSFYVMVSR